MTIDWNSLRWRNLELPDVPGLAGFAPPEWRLPLDTILLQHFGRSYFVARVTCAAETIVAIGQGIATGRTGWVGNVIVRADARNRGLGTRMTEAIMDELRRRGCSRMLLVATALGEPIYRKLGFRSTAEYVFLDVPRLAPDMTPGIRRFAAADTDAVLRLDALATGEARGDLLLPHVGSGWVHTGAGGVDGYYLPSLGAGQIMAATVESGLALLRFKHAFLPDAAVVPEGNAAALEFLLAQGARETARAPRMALGGDADWRPDWIFARASGYCG